MSDESDALQDVKENCLHLETVNLVAERIDQAARYRKALSQIADSQWVHDLGDALEIARKALSEAKE